MTYIDEIASQIYDICAAPSDNGFAQSNEYKTLYRAYAVLALTNGDETTSMDVHDAWSAWRVETDPTHPSIKPFDQLDARIQALDDKYRDAIIAVAKTNITGRYEKPDYVAEINRVYFERNQLVAALSKVFPSYLARTSPDPDPGWRYVVYIDGPTGQMGWHIPDRELPFFRHLSIKENAWDGHTTEAKYARLEAIPAP